MHIVMVTDYYLPTLGGIQTSIKAQKEGLEKDGHRVTILCPLHEPSRDSSIIKLPTFKYIKPDNYPLAGPSKKVIEAAKTEIQKLGDIDIVHVHSDMAAGVAGLLAAKELGIPVIQTMHGREDVYAQKILPLPELTSLIPAKMHNKYISHRGASIDLKEPNTQTRTAQRMWKLMVSHANFADHVIVPSNHFARKLKRHGVHKPITVLSNGIEDSVLHKLGEAKTRCYSSKENLKIMWCGRVSPEKRPIEFLKAVKDFPNNVEVNMYGDGVAMKKARRYIAENKLRDVVNLHGGVSQQVVLNAMNKHHVFMSTSYNFDNQPMVLLEAIASGLPVIYCDPDMAEVVPAKGSILTKTHLSKGIVEAVCSVQSKPELVERMSKAMIRYRSKVTQTNHLKQLIEVYNLYSLKKM